MFSVVISLRAIVLALLGHGPDLLSPLVQSIGLLPHFLLLGSDLLFHLDLVTLSIAEPARGIAIRLALLGLRRGPRLEIQGAWDHSWLSIRIRVCLSV